MAILKGIKSLAHGFVFGAGAKPSEGAEEAPDSSFNPPSSRHPAVQSTFAGPSRPNPFAPPVLSSSPSGDAEAGVELDEADQVSIRKSIVDWSKYATRAALTAFDKQERAMAEYVPDEGTRFRAAISTGAAAGIVSLDSLDIEARDVTAGLEAGLASLEGTFQGEMMKLNEEREVRRSQLAQSIEETEAEIARLSEQNEDRRQELTSLDADAQRQAARRKRYYEEVRQTAHELSARMTALLDVLQGMKKS